VHFGVRRAGLLGASANIARTPGVQRRRGEHRPAGQAIRGGQVGGQRRVAGTGIHAVPSPRVRVSSSTSAATGALACSVSRGLAAQRHGDGGLVHAGGRQYGGADVFDGDRPTVGKFDDQAPQPYPAIGVHRAVLSGAAGDEFTGRLRYR
jgi:hypothetical protein